MFFPGQSVRLCFLESKFLDYILKAGISKARDIILPAGWYSVYEQALPLSLFHFLAFFVLMEIPHLEELLLGSHPLFPRQGINHFTLFISNITVWDMGCSDGDKLTKIEVRLFSNKLIFHWPLCSLLKRLCPYVHNFFTKELI